jgi:uncharacterized protein
MATEPRTTPTYVGTLVGESTSREFRLAVKHEAVREQDIIAVDAEMSHASQPHTPIQQIRIWAKVQRIERINPLFPLEAGHELAETQTDPFDTVLSLSREMVTAVCQILGAEPLRGKEGGKLDQLRYPAKPATRAYRPDSTDIARVVLGELGQKQNRALDLAELANRPEVTVKVDGDAIVTRHLAILAMTGAGKSWTARRLIEELAAKNWPMVIFDPRGVDYSGLPDVPSLKGKVRRYYAQFPVFEQDSETVAAIVSTLGYELKDAMELRFDELFKAAKSFVSCDDNELQERKKWLANLLGNPEIERYSTNNLYFIANLAEAAVIAIAKNEKPRKNEEKQPSVECLKLKELGWRNIDTYSGTDGKTLEAVKKRASKAAKALRRMEHTNKRVAANSLPLPTNRKELVQYGQISVVSLAGYTSDFQATIYSIIADEIFDSKVQNDLNWPVLFVLEEAHNFVPAKGNTPAELRAIATTRQIAQEGRKFGVGLVLISQRPSRLDETALSQCNSFVIMRMVNPADQNFVQRVVESLGEEDAKMLPNLDRGEALLSGQMINFPVLVKIKKPESRGEREEDTDAFEKLEETRRGH